MQDTNGLILTVLFRWRRLPGWAIFTVPNAEILKKANSVQPDRNSSTPSPLPLPLSSSSEAEGHITVAKQTGTKTSSEKHSSEQSEMRKTPPQGSTYRPHCWGPAGGKKRHHPFRDGQGAPQHAWSPSGSNHSQKENSCGL